MVDIRREEQRRHWGLRRTGWVGAMVLLGALGFCHFKRVAPRVDAGTLLIDTVRSGVMVVEVRAAGTLIAEDTAWIPAATAGRVERIRALPGAVVAADTPLIELSNPEVVQEARDAELQVRAAEAELRSRRLQIRSAILSQEAVVAAARAEHEEARNRARADSELAQSGLTSALALQASRGREQQLAVRAAVEEKRHALARESEVTDLAAAHSRLDQLRATFELRQQQREALHVRSGRIGVLQQVAVEVGARVSAGTNLARIAAPEPLKASIQISQIDASQVAVGQRVRVDTHQGIVAGTVSRIDPSVQNGSVTVDVQLPPNLPAGARPDLSVDAAIEVMRIEEAVHVNRPVRAGPNTSLALFRLAPDGRSATRVAVRIGRTSYNAVEILSGLQPGDRVILSDTSPFEKFDHIIINR